MAFSTAGRGPLRAEINMTPMIDILLVLIIVFMVVVSMSQQKGLDAQIPQPATGNPPPQPERTIIIQVMWTGDKKPGNGEAVVSVLFAHFAIFAVQHPDFCSGKRSP